MLFLSICPAEKGPAGTVLHYPARTIEGACRSPASLADALAEFEAMRQKAEALGAPVYVSAFWQPSQAIGGSRAPVGLKRAIAAGQFRAFVNVN